MTNGVVTDVTVVMPAFNAEEHIGASIASVLAQTWPGFKLIVIDDGSTDRTREIIHQFNDPRIGLFTNESNRGLAAARNRGLEEAHTPFVAWLDSDDIAHPNRLRHQLKLMERNPDIAVCGTWGRTLGLSPDIDMRYPRRSKFVHARLLFDNPLLTSSVMMRTSALDEPLEAFREAYAPSEDYDLWERISHTCRIVNLPRTLTRYRQHDRQVSKRQAARQLEAVMAIQQRQLDHVGLAATPDELSLHAKIGVDWGRTLTSEEVGVALDWLDRIEEANRRSRVYQSSALSMVLAHRRSLVRSVIHPATRLLGRVQSALQ